MRSLQVSTEFKVQYSDGLTSDLIHFDAVIILDGITVNGEWAVPDSLETGQCSFFMKANWGRWLELEEEIATLGEVCEPTLVTDLHDLSISVQRGQRVYHRNFYGLGCFPLAGDLTYLVDFMNEVRDRIRDTASKPVERTCPACDSHRIEEISYGLSCLDAVRDDSKLFRCMDCAAEFGRIPNWLRDLAREDRLCEQQGVERGLLDAKVNKYGFVKCPYCGETFLITDSQSWDGQKHVRCKTRINPTYPPGGIQSRWYH